VSGAVVPGPVGAAAGAFIGYTAGPSITRWGMQRSSSRSGARHATQFGPVPQRQAAAVAGPPSAVRTSPLRPRESRHHRFRGSNRAPARDARGATRYLTRRANHLHIFIIATIQRPAPGNRPRVFSIRSVVPRADRCVLRHVFRAKHPEGTGSSYGRTVRRVLRIGNKRGRRVLEERQRDFNRQSASSGTTSLIIARLVCKCSKRNS
jgi:hypothetical protein